MWDDNWFDESDTAYIGRTAAYYAEDEDEDGLYVPDLWTYSREPKCKDFAGEVYQLNDDGKTELNWWIRCQRMNLYERNHAFNPNLNSKKEEYEELVKYYGTKIK